MSYADLKVADLKDECKKRGLSVAGKKAELVSRLQAHDAEHTKASPGKRAHEEGDAGADSAATAAAAEPEKRARVEPVVDAAPAPSVDVAPTPATPAPPLVTTDNTADGCTLFVSGLVRPFTEGALRAHLSLAGEAPIAELWLNEPQKSVALATFASAALAATVRERVHGQVWPKLAKALTVVPATDEHLRLKLGPPAQATPVSASKAAAAPSSPARTTPASGTRIVRRVAADGSVTTTTAGDAAAVAPAPAALDVDALFDKTACKPALYFTYNKEWVA